MRAPVDGFVGTLNVQNRSVVAANTPLMTLVDLSKLEVELEVPETYVADMGIGMTAEIQLGDTRATGKLSALSPEVVKNQVLARVRFDGAQPKGLRQSQRVTARLLIEEKPNALILPRGPFIESEGGRFAYVMQDGIAVRTPITARRDQRLGGRNPVRREAGRQGRRRRHRYLCQRRARLHQQVSKNNP